MQPLNDQDQRLHDFAKRINRRKTSGGIDPSIRLPSWDELLRIDAEAEQAAAEARQAIAGPGVVADGRAVVDATENTLDGCGPQAGTQGQLDGRT